MAKGKVIVGEEFEVSAVNAEGENGVDGYEVGILERTLKTRDTLTYLYVGLLGCALVVATGIGLRDGSFDEVNAVWVAGAAPLGYVLRAYFGKD